MWNYRVMKRNFNQEKQFAIYEVYYDDNGNPNAWSMEPMYICGETLEELMEDFKHYSSAFDKPVLDYNELEKEFKK